MDGGGRNIDDTTAETSLSPLISLILLMIGVAKILFQLNFTRLRGGPIGGICCVASAPYASAIR